MNRKTGLNFFVVVCTALLSNFAQGQIAPCDALKKVCDQERLLDRKVCLEGLRYKLGICVANAQKADDGLDQVLYEKLKAKIDAANAVLDKKNQNIDADGIIVANVMSKYQQYFMVVTANYQKLMTHFVNSYKPSEENVKSQIEAQYANAEISDRSRLVASIVQLDAIQRSEARMAFEQRAQADLTSKNAADLTEKIKNKLSGQSSYIEANGLGQVLEPFSDMQPSIASVKYYIEKRQKSFGDKIEEARTILQARLAAVTKIEIEREIGPTLKESVYLSSVAKFMGEVETARALAFKEGPQHEKLKMPYFTTQYLNLRAFLDYEYICGPTSKPKWTESGCLRFNQYKAQASRLYNGAIGTLIRQNLDTIQTKHPNLATGKISHIRSLIQNKKYSEAVELYDIILNSDGFR